MTDKISVRHIDIGRKNDMGALLLLYFILLNTTLIVFDTNPHTRHFIFPASGECSAPNEDVGQVQGDKMPPRVALKNSESCVW